MSGCAQCGAGAVPGIALDSVASSPRVHASTCDACSDNARLVCSPKPPLLVGKRWADFLDALKSGRAGYTPEWSAGPDDPDPGAALLAIVARYLDIQADGVNAMPLRLQLEFLDTLGAALLPAQSARTPLVFKLLDTASGDATIPAGTRVGAVLPPPPPSLNAAADTLPAPKPEFFTEHEITAMRGRIAAVYTIDPNDDVYADHTPRASVGFALFSDMTSVPHRIYAGHDSLFRLAGEAQIELTFDFATPLTNPAGVATHQRPLLIDWEYLSNDGWLPLTLVEDRTQRFTRDGKVMLAKLCGPDSKEDAILGASSYWIRGTVASRGPAARIAATPPAGALEVEVDSTTELLPGDVVTVDGVVVATLTGTTATSVLVDRLPTNARAGEYLTLANALPPLRPDGADEEGTLPLVDVIRTRVGLAKSDLPLDAAYLDGFVVDIGKDFYPFGAQPQAFAAFYVACKDAFSRTRARVTLNATFVQRGNASANLRVAAEYYDGTRWRTLGSDEEYTDGTNQFAEVVALDPEPVDAAISFVVPSDWADSEINGEQNRWLRFRLASGEYGQPLSILVVPDPADPSAFVVEATPATLRPPILAQLRVDYVVFSNPTPLDHCVTENEFVFADRSNAARWPRSSFAPFTPVSDRTPALHLGFSDKPPAALVSMLAAVAAAATDAGPQPYIWDYWGIRGWTELSVRDTTDGLQQSGVIQFIGAPDAEPRDGFGGLLYRIRARLKTGLSRVDHQAQLRGVWLNAVWASEGARYVRDTLGTSNGNPDQTFALPPMRAPAAQQGVPDVEIVRDAAQFERALDVPVAGVPVLADEVVEVREWTGRGDDWQTAVGEVPLRDIRFDVDPADRAIKTAAWVRWHAQPHLYASGTSDRHYTVERARGVFRFPGIDGFISPAGAPVVVSYVTGGGATGNVPAGAVREIHSGIGFVESVTNPLDANGGAGVERLRDARDRGAQALRNRDRAVSMEDYEWIARSASSEVARARALPLEGPDGTGSRGLVGVVLLPQSNDVAPLPSPELCTRVLRALRRRVPAGIAAGVRVLPPEYVRVGVRAEILPIDPNEAGRVEARVRALLTQFLHPLAGGSAGQGWDFGEAPYVSDVARLLERTPGVDAVRFLQLTISSSLHGDTVPVGRNALVAAGDIQLKLLVPSTAYAVA